MKATKRAWIFLGGAAVALAAGCDRTVALEAPTNEFSDIFVSGVCAVKDDLREVELSVILVGKESEGLRPDDYIFDKETTQGGVVGELLKPESFTFEVPTGLEVRARAESDPETNEHGVKEEVALRVDALRFDHIGGEARKDDARLVILLLDQSGTLAGKNPANAAEIPDLNRATDPNDERITFFEALVAELPEDDEITVVPFNGTLAPRLTPPTANRDVVLGALAELGHNTKEDGGTPLALALKTVLENIIDFRDEDGTYANHDLNPVVVLFTDGVEGGDTSGGVTLEEVTEQYVRRRLETPDGDTVDAPPVPVIVLHLQPPLAAAAPPIELDRGRSPELMDLACRTGGEYYFVESRLEQGEIRTDFSKADQTFPIIVGNRLIGAWRLTVPTDLHDAQRFPTGGYFVTTEVGVNLAGRKKTAPLIKKTDSDNRLWLYKK